MKKFLLPFLFALLLAAGVGYSQSAGTGTATLTFTYNSATQAAAVANGTTTGFNVYRAVAACPIDGSLPASLALQTTTPLAVTVLTYVDSGLAPGAYCYIVKATGPGGESVASNTGGKSIFGAPPGVGTTLIVK